MGINVKKLTKKVLKPLELFVEKLLGYKTISFYYEVAVSSTSKTNNNYILAGTHTITYENLDQFNLFMSNFKNRCKNCCIERGFVEQGSDERFVVTFITFIQI